MSRLGRTIELKGQVVRVREVVVTHVWVKSVWSGVCTDSWWIFKQNGGGIDNHPGEQMRNLCMVGESGK